MDESLKKIEQGAFFLIAGPCVIENEETPIEIATYLKQLSNKYEIPLIFKASYKKANRSSIHSFTGIGDLKGLNVLKDIASKLNVPVITDVHSEEEARTAADFVDVIQIPAFLCRQTELLLAAAKTGKIVNVKKGQFMSPESMRFAVEKVRSENEKVWLTERGNSFGYQNLVVDFPGVKQMQSFCDTVIMDCTHALQRPNQSAGVTGGNPDMIEALALAATSIGVNGLFIETHPRPSEAKSDGANMLPMDQLDQLLSRIMALRETVSTWS